MDMNKIKAILFFFILTSFVFSDLTVKWYINYFNGIDFIKKGEYKKAKVCLEDALAQKGKPKKSTTFYAKIRGPYIPYYYLAKVYFHLGQYEVAKSKLEMSERFKIAPKIQSDFYDLKSQIEKKLKESKSKTIDKSITLYQKGLESYTGGNFDRALEFLNKAIAAKGKESQRAKELKAKIIKEMQFEKALASDYNKGLNLFKIGKFNEALTVFNSISKRKEFYKDVPVLIEKCKKQIEMENEFQKIKNEVYKGLNLESNKEKLNILKNDGFDSGKVARLLVVLNEKLNQKSIEERKKEIGNLYLEGEKYFKSGNLKKAMDIFNRVSESQYASFELKQKSINRISEIQAKLKELNLLSNLITKGKKLMKEGKYDESEGVLKKALEISPNNRTIKDLLSLITQFKKSGGKTKSILKFGILSYFRGDYGGSINSLRNYLNLTDKNVELANFFIAASLISKGLIVGGKEGNKLITQGKKIFSQLKNKGYKLDKKLQSYISPKVLNYF